MYYVQAWLPSPSNHIHIRDFYEFCLQLPIFHSLFSKYAKKGILAPLISAST